MSSEKQHHEPDSQDIPYEYCLRPIGAVLDEQNRSRVRVVEVPGGFEVFSHAGADDAEPERRFFTLSELLTPRWEARRQKVRFLRREIPSPPSSGASVSYQDFFRALGHELDEAGAYMILLDEVDDGCLLTYQHYGRESGFMLHKRQVMLARDDRSLLLKAAIDRRNQR